MKSLIYTVLIAITLALVACKDSNAQTTNAVSTMPPAEVWEVVMDHAYVKVFHGVTVTKVTDATVSIMFDSGMATLKLSDLPTDLQKRFNYDPAKAQAELAKAYAANAQETKLINAQVARQEQESQANESPASNGKPAIDRDALMQQLVALQTDADFQRRQISSENSGGATHGTCHEKFAYDKAQIDIIQRQLRQ